MNKSKNLLWGSLPVLIVAVIAILAFVRGKWELPLLVAAFTLWGLWAVWKLLIPAWQESGVRSAQAEKAEQRASEASVPAGPDPALVNLLLLHTNYRISAFLTGYYPNVRWEWKVANPGRFVVTGGMGRIRVYGIPDYDYADVTLDQKARLNIVLLKIAPVGAAAPAAPDTPAFNPQAWFEMQGRELLTRVITELDSRGHKKAFLKEDGSLCVQPLEGGGEIVADTFPSFPEKVYWSRLAEVLKQNGLAATVMDHYIQVAW